MTNLLYEPGLSPEITEENLRKLLAAGMIDDRDMLGRVARLANRFSVYASTFPHGLWAPGLAITDEYRTATEMYLPMAELVKAFDRFLSLALKYVPPAGTTAIHAAASWPDALHELHPLVSAADPAALLKRLLTDQCFRTVFLFAIFLPNRHGGSFNRYPEQSEFILERLKKRVPDRTRALRCLDTACATGESTYGLALLLLDNGIPPDSFLVHGSTIEPLELFAAAHIFFPHDPGREQSYRRQAGPLFTTGAAEKISFFADDITRPPFESDMGYDIILCNGLLGGPAFSEPGAIESAVSGLRARLNDGGAVLVADRFHGGWKKRIPTSLLHIIFTEAGFKVRELATGLAAEKA